MPKIIGRPTTPPLTTAPEAARPPAPAKPADPAGWKQFQDDFYAKPATQLNALRARAAEIGKPELVASLSGLQIVDNGNHSIASNTMRNYPIKDIYAELYTAAPAPGWQAFEEAFYKAPATQLEVLRAKAAEIGKPEIVAPFTGLQIQDGGHHSIASNTMRNYPVKEAYAALFGG
jgi:hypothetical protein